MTKPDLLWQYLFQEARDALAHNPHDPFARGLIIGKGIMLSIYIDEPVRGEKKLNELSNYVFENKAAADATPAIPPLVS